MTNESALKERAIESYLWLPFGGLIFMPLAAVYTFVYQKQSIYTSASIGILVPFIGFLLFALPCIFVTRKIPPFLKGKYKYISLLCVVITIIIIWANRTNEEIPRYRLEDTFSLLNNNDEIALIFTSANCKYCKDMKNVYHRVANKHKKIPIAEVDLTGKVESDLLEFHNKYKIENISHIPVIIKFKGGEEIERLEGMQKYSLVDDFIKNGSVDK